jgi:hypothetical protein
VALLCEDIKKHRVVCPGAFAFEIFLTFIKRYCCFGTFVLFLIRLSELLPLLMALLFILLLGVTCCVLLLCSSVDCCWVALFMLLLFCGSVAGVALFVFVAGAAWSTVPAPVAC